jgi:thioredoxin 1
MSLQDQLITFQNKAERDFAEKKTFTNVIKYMIALKLFFASSLYALISLPFRFLANKLAKPAKSTIHDTEGTIHNFDELIGSRSYVLVDFWAEWCGPCILMNSILNDFSKEAKGIDIVKVNADSNSKLMGKYNLRGIPQFLLFKNGKEIKRHAGPMSVNELHRFCSEATAELPA